MSFKLLTISSLYSEFLSSFYKKHSDLKYKSFREQYFNILEDTSEPIGSYTRMFCKLGINAECIIDNADILQKQWAKENGIKSFDNKQIIIKQIENFKPDVLWIENIELAEKEWIDKLRSQIPEIRLIIASHCAPYGSRVIENFKNLDFIFTCTPGIKSDFEKKGLRAYLVYHAFNPEVLNKFDSNDNLYSNNFIFSGSLFMGSGYHDRRLELLESLLREKTDLKIYGNIEKAYKIKAKKALHQLLNILIKLNLKGFIRYIPLLEKYEEYGQSPIPDYSDDLIRAVYPPLFGMEMYRLLKHSKITLNIHGEVAGDYAGNLRLFEATGVGSCLVTDNKKNMNELFICGEEVLVYDSFEDCIEKVKWLLINEKERNKIALAGQKRTLGTHTVEQRCRLIVDIILKELAKI